MGTEIDATLVIQAMRDQIADMAVQLALKDAEITTLRRAAAAEDEAA